jgi:hypothetical protein
MTLIIMDLIATLSIRIECRYAYCHYAECLVFLMGMLSVVMLSVVLLSFVVPLLWPHSKHKLDSLMAALIQGF